MRRLRFEDLLNPVPPVPFNKNRNIPVKAEFEWDKIGAWYNFNPYIISFVYPKHGSPYIVKGGLKDVRKYLKEHNDVSLVHETIFYHGTARSNVEFYGFNKRYDVSLYTTEYDFNTMTKLKGGKQTYLRVRDYATKKEVLIKKFRRPPRCWISELNEFCK